MDVHHEYGKTAWRDLFAPAVTLADSGFDISPRLAAAIADAAPQLRVDKEAASYFLDSDGSPKTAQTKLTNPAYSKTLGVIASDPQSFYTGDIAQSHRRRGGRHLRRPHAQPDYDGGPGRLHRQATRTGVHPYRGKEICGMPPPSSGGIAVAATLGILEHFAMNEHKPTDMDLDGGKPSVMGVHLISEAERLAYADRDKYVADTDFVPLPGGTPNTLLNSNYLAERAALISEQRSMGTAKPGDFGAPPSTPVPVPEHGTSQISVIDAQGNAAALTTTVESAFGSFHMVDGFILNNQLTDFSAEPAGPDGVPVPNRVEPGKRPRSTMAPTLMFDTSGTGSRPSVRGAGFPGRRSDHPVRRENDCGNCRLGNGSAAGGGHGGLRRGELAEDQRRWRASQHRRDRQRRPRPAGAGSARTRPSGQRRRPVQRVVGDRAGIRRVDRRC